MPLNKEAYLSLLNEIGRNVTLVAVSKTKPVTDILELYTLGHRDFAENYVQELLEKQLQLPTDIRWHFIGHLQSNKVKYIAPFIYLIQGVDSVRLLTEINKQGKKIGRVINVLLQVHIASEDTKFGFSGDEIDSIIHERELAQFDNLKILGVMGMATFTEDVTILRKEFTSLKMEYSKLKDHAHMFPNIDPKIISMGMSSDYKIAIDEGSNMIRVGSMLFGERSGSGG